MAESKEKQANILLNENAEQQDKTAEVARLYNRGAEVFGSSNGFMQWMDSNMRVLGIPYVQ